MAKPYSRDLRDRVVSLVGRSHLSGDGGAVWGERRQRGQVVAALACERSAAAKPMGGRRPLRLASECAWLLARIAEKPDLTLRAMMAELAERGTPASYGAVWRFFQHEGITFKKKACTPGAGSCRHRPPPDPVEEHQRRLDPKRLVFIEETWAKTNITRRYGRNRRGACLVAQVPQGRWRTLTFLAALRHDRVTAPCVIDADQRPSFPLISSSSSRRP